jgi:hypothetical protein
MTNKINSNNIINNNAYIFTSVINKVNVVVKIQAFSYMS